MRSSSNRLSSVYYLYLSTIGEWTKPPKGTTQAQLVLTYRHVVQMSGANANNKLVASWNDGKRTPAK